MTPRQQKRILNVSSTALVALACGVLWWGFALPSVLNDNVDPGASDSRTRSTTPLTLNHQLAVSDFEEHWDIKLRQPLYDPPPPPPKKVEKKPLPPLRVKLLATMIEPGNPVAMIQTGSGDVVFRKIGDQVGPDDAAATITEIQPGIVRVVRGEEESQLSVDGGRRN